MTRITALRTASPVERWSLANAVAMLTAVPVALWWRSPWPLLIVGGVLLAVLVGVCRQRWTPAGHFGLANGVTALRVIGLGFLPWAAQAGSALPIGLGVALLLADGLDGWWARRRGLASEFGAFFDKEADALFLLMLCALTAFSGRLPVWILGAGLLRYGFVILLFCLQPAEKTEERLSFARYAYGTTVGALLGAFLPYPVLYKPAVVLATGALLLSFTRSTVQIMRRARRTNSTPPASKSRDADAS